MGNLYVKLTSLCFPEKFYTCGIYMASFCFTMKFYAWGIYIVRSYMLNIFHGFVVVS